MTMQLGERDGVRYEWHEDKPESPRQDSVFGIENAHFRAANRLNFMPFVSGTSSGEGNGSFRENDVIPLILEHHREAFQSPSATLSNGSVYRIGFPRRG